MSSTKRLPEPSELRRLQKQGLTADEIAAMFRTAPQTVYNKRSTARQEREYAVRPANQFMPWPLMRPDHQRSQTAVNLRIHNLIQSGGDSIPSIIRDRVTEWVDLIEYNNFVISYHPETESNLFNKEGGFFVRPRRASDSPGIMQLPGEAEQPPGPEQLDEWTEQWRVANRR